MTATVQPIRPDEDIYAAARRIIFTAGDDWTAIMAAAKTLAGSPEDGDRAIARRARAQHLAHMQRQMDAMAEREAQETSLKIAMRYAPELRRIAIGAVVALIVSAGFYWLVL